MVTGELVAPKDVTVMTVLYVPIVRPATLGETVTGFGAVPLVREITPACT
jgi:hypothetical protein